MEQLLGKLAVSGATFVGKAAFSYATSMALRKLSNFVNIESKSIQTDLLKQVARLESKISRKMSILLPIIDLCEFSCASGYSTLESVLEQTLGLKLQLEELGNSLDNITENKLDLSVIIAQLDGILAEIQELIPLLSLAIQVSGATYKNTLDKGISPNRLLKASSLLSSKKHIATFPVKMYTLFEGSARKPEMSDWTWKEEYTRARAIVSRTGTYKYSLNIQQDLNDGRYHEELKDQKQSGGFISGDSKLFSIIDIDKAFYTTSGKLLNIEDATLPLLILKIKSPKQQKTTETPKNNSTIEWIALELYSPSLETQDSDTESDSESNDLNLNLCKDFENMTIRKGDLSQLCLLDYIIRLCSLEMREHKSHLECSDQLICQVLNIQANQVDIPMTKTPKKELISNDLVKTRLADQFLAG